MARTSHTGPREWDAEVYDQVAQPQYEWSREVLERLPLRGDETVLDAGCGSGRVTEALVERLPAGRVIAVDASNSMVEKARERLGEAADVRQGDLAELQLEQQVDAVFSNAVFHWLLDHDRLFERLFAALAPGGMLVAQCGGEGNVASLAATIRAVAAEQSFAVHLRDLPSLWNFASPQDTERRLRAAGFAGVRCWLQPKSVKPERPREYLEAVTLGPHLQHLPAELRDPFVDRVAAEAGEPLVIDYVRLNIEARRP